jgi:Rit1 N-terminal domain/Rit1 DUSP-like domain
LLCSSTLLQHLLVTSLQDALTKTIPIWAAVLNRAVGKIKQDTGAIENYFSNEQLQLNLPHWISKNEKNQIEQRIDAWVDELLALGVDLSLLESSLQKPLRCLWISQTGNDNAYSEDEDWLEMAENEEMKSKYTYVVLISASIPNKRQRRRLVIGSSSFSSSLSSSLMSSPSCSHNGSSNNDSSNDSNSDEEESNDNDSNGNDSSDGEIDTRSSSQLNKTRNTTNNNKKLIFKQPLDLMYDYVPGAGDDEESWAKGLTPTLMWDNIEELLRAGDEDIGGVVKRLVKSKLMSERAQKRTGAGARALGGRNSGIDGSEWKVEWIAGCVGLGISTNVPAKLLEGEGGGEGGVAVLNVGSEASILASFELLNIKDCSGILFRYLHVPVAGDKNLKRAVLHAIPAAVNFASNHLSSSGAAASDKYNKIVVIAEPEAIDIAASIVVAILIACFSVEDTCLQWSRPARFFPASTTQLIPAIGSGSTSDVTKSIARKYSNEFTRATVRQYLSLVSVSYPQVVLSKSLLKQIYNAFLPESMVCPLAAFGKEEKES